MNQLEPWGLYGGSNLEYNLFDSWVPMHLIVPHLPPAGSHLTPDGL